MATNIQAMVRLLPLELGQQKNEEFKEVLSILKDYYTDTLSNPTLALLYYSIKLHAINYLLGNAWQYYDTSAMDVSERESQKYKNLIDLYNIVKEQQTTEVVATGGTSFAIGVIAKRAPIPFTDLSEWINPNSQLFRGTPEPLRSNIDT